MPKKRSKISKKVTFSKEDVPLPNENQYIGRVEKMLGGDRLLVLCDDEELIVRLPGKYRGQLLFRRNSYVLLEQMIRGSDENLDIVHKYSSEEVEHLRKSGLIEDDEIA